MDKNGVHQHDVPVQEVMQANSGVSGWVCLRRKRIAEEEEEEEEGGWRPVAARVSPRRRQRPAGRVTARRGCHAPGWAPVPTPAA